MLGMRSQVKHMLKGDMDVPTDSGPRGLWTSEEVSISTTVQENVEQGKTKWYTLAAQGAA